MALSECNVKTNTQGREMVDHGTAMFPIGCYDDDLLRDEVPWHWHDELEVFFVYEGTAEVSVGTEKYMVGEGEGCFINAGELHMCQSADGGECRIHSAVFHPRLIGGSVDSVFWHNYIQPLLRSRQLTFVRFDQSMPWHREANALIEQAWQTNVREQRGYEFEVRDLLSRLILRLSSYHPAAAVQPSEKTLRDNERMKRMLQYIHDHYAEAVTVADIAGQAMISESECLRCFRNVIGTPPIQYLKQFRIQKAAELLAAGEGKVIDIGADCGFLDASYFVKSFRELKGCTPAEYRKRFSAAER